MSNTDEYAVSRILESLKGDQSLIVYIGEPIASDEHEIEELNPNEAMKRASNANKICSKSLKVRSKLPTKSESSKSLKVRSKLPAKSHSSKSLKVRSKLPTKAQSDIHIDQPKVKRKKVSLTVMEVKEICSSSNVQKFKSLRLRNPPKPFYNAIKCLSILQKKKVIDMGFGSLLEFSCAGIPSKLGHFVVDKFHAKSMKLKLENGDIQITPELIQHILGIPCWGIPVESLIVNDKNKECYVNWRSQFVKELRPSDILRKIEETEDNGIIFVLNFIILFLNSMVECVQSGKCKTDVVERIDEDVDLKTVDWCGYIYKCLKKCKDGWKRDDAGSYFKGPVTVLVLIYLELTSFKQLDAPINIPAIKFWSVEMMKKRELLEIESGGFGRCEIKKLSEKRVAHEESEVEIIKVLNGLDSKLASFMDAKIELEVLFTSAFRKFPNCQVLTEKKHFFHSILLSNDIKDDTILVGPSYQKADQGDFVNVEQEYDDDMMARDYSLSDSEIDSLFEKSDADELPFKEQEILVVDEEGVNDIVVDEQVKFVKEEA